MRWRRRRNRARRRRRSRRSRRGVSRELLARVRFEVLVSAANPTRNVPFLRAPTPARMSGLRSSASGSPRPSSSLCLRARRRDASRLRRRSPWRSSSPLRLVARGFHLRAVTTRACARRRADRRRWAEHQVDLGAAGERLTRDLDAYRPRRRVREKAHGIDRLARRPGSHQHALAGQMVAARSAASMAAISTSSRRKAPDAVLALREKAASGSTIATPRARSVAGARGRLVLEHRGVHRRGHDDRHARRERRSSADRRRVRARSSRACSPSPARWRRPPPRARARCAGSSRRIPQRGIHRSPRERRKRRGPTNRRHPRS